MEVSQSKIEKWLEKKRLEIDKRIEKYLPRKVTDKWLRNLLKKKNLEISKKVIQKAVLDPFWEFLDRGGKRWRPALFLLIAKALGADVEKIKDFSIIPEIVHNGCLSENTWILKNPGEQVKITEIKKGDYVYTMTPTVKLSKNKVLSIKSNGIKKIYCLKTRNREIEATENHPFLVITKKQPERCRLTKSGLEKIRSKLKRGDIKKLSNLLNRKLKVLYNALSPYSLRLKSSQLLEKAELEFIFNWLGLKLEDSDYLLKQTKFESPVIELVWRKLKEIKPGDFIVILNKLPDEGESMELPQPLKNPLKDKAVIPKKTNEDFCQLVGYILGDGSISIDKKSSRIQLSPSNDEEEILAYSSLFSKVFSYKLKRHKGSKNLYCGSFKVCWLLDKLGLNKKATEKTIPDWIFTLPEKQKLAFLRGYLDSDGWVGKDGTTYFSSSSKILVEKLKLLLDSLGFNSSHILYKKNRNLWKISKKKFSDQWSISLCNPRLVLEKIGTEKSVYRKRLERKQKRKGNIYRYLEKFPTLPIDFPTFRIDRVKEIIFKGEKPVFDLMVENSHNFIANNIVVHNSLIVDDIEDQSELRRGKPCLHKIFGEDIAINLGNFLYFFPIFIFEKNKEKIDSKTYQRLLEIFFEEMLSLHFGQGTDIFWHRGLESKISEKEYFQMCSFKTGCMARLSCKMAAILAKADQKMIERMGEVGEKIGVAFQIQDDILDLKLEEEKRKKFGKIFGNDIKEGKRSLPVILTLMEADKKDKKELLKILGKHPDSLKEKERAIKIIEKYNSIEKAKEIAKNFEKEALEILENFLPKSKAKKNLKALISFLVKREF